jgi:hypothetical protein
MPAIIQNLENNLNNQLKIADFPDKVVIAIRFDIKID